MSTVDLAPALQIIVRRHGEAVLSERARMHGLLRDYAPNAVPEIAALIRAHEAGCVTRLGAGALDAEAVEAEARTLADRIGPGAETAAAAWAGAIGFARSGLASQPVPLGLQSLQPLPLPSTAAEKPRRKWFGLFAVAAASGLAELIRVGLPVG